MIVKKVPRKQKRPTNGIVRAHAAKLAKYIVNAREEDARALTQFEDDSYARDLGHYAMGEEKVLATKSQNFRSNRLTDQLAEMDELIKGVGSDKDLVDHWVISWHESDNPTNDEVFDAIDTFQHCLGTEKCPSITAIHGNTKHLHAHLAQLRIDPETGEIIPRRYNGWDIDAAHRALAVIADRYPTWTVTPNHSYESRSGRIIHCETGADVGSTHDPNTWAPLHRVAKPTANGPNKKLLAKIDYQSLLFEENTGFKSRKRVAVEEAVPILLAATNWSDAHKQLANIGIALELAKNKSGANLVIDGKNVKASIYDGTALAKLVKRWGTPFEPRPDHVKLAEYELRPMFPDNAERARYFDAKNAFIAQVKQMIAEVRSSEAGYKTSVPSHSCDPAKLLHASFPSFDDWTAGSMAPDPAAILAGAGQIRGFAGDPLTMVEQREIDGYQSRQLDRGVAYYKVGDIYSRPALFDTGSRIYINDDDRASIVAALRLMSARSGGRPVKPFGPSEFLAQVQRIADAEGIALEIASPRQPITAKAQPFPMSASGDNEASALQNKAAVCEIATAIVAPAPVVAPNAPVVPRVVPIIPPVPPAIPEVAPVISPATSAVPAVAPDVPAIPRVVSSVAPVVSAEASIEPLAIRQDTESVKSSPTVNKIEAERPLGSALSEPSSVEALISMFGEAKTDEERREAAAQIRSMPMAFAEMNRIGGDLWKAEQLRFAELQHAQQWGHQGRGY